MRTVNIYDFFPIRDDEMMSQYLRDDRDYEQRKEQFSSILLNARAQKKNWLAQLSRLFSTTNIFRPTDGQQLSNYTLLFFYSYLSFYLMNVTI